MITKSGIRAGHRRFVPCSPKGMIPIGMAVGFLSLFGCQGPGHPAEPSGERLTVGEDRRLEGWVIAVDATPMFVDGDGKITLQTEHHGRVLIRIPARERVCQAQGLGVFSSVASGDSVRLMGRVTRPKEVTVCVEEDHFLEKVGRT